MAELERIANHLSYIGAVCNDAAFALMQAHCAVLARAGPAPIKRHIRPPADDDRVVLVGSPPIAMPPGSMESAASS